MVERARAAAGRASPTLFIHPDAHTFRAVDALITNFHLPRSSLLMLVCAFAGRETVLRAYHEAVVARLPVLQLRRRDVDCVRVAVTAELKLRPTD